MDSASKPKSNKKKVGSIIGNVLIWIFVAFSVVITVLAFLANSNSDGVPAIGGTVISPVLSPSMEPTIKKGDIILSRKIEDDTEKKSLNKDDIITFRADLDGDGTPEINTHRIIERTEDGSRITYQTKGDNNQFKDNYTVPYSDIISIYEGKRIPVLGNVIEFLLKPTGFFICIVIPLILFFLFEIIMFVRKVIEVKNSDKKQITAADEEMIKKKAIEEYLRAQQEAEKNKAENSASSDIMPEPDNQPISGPEATDTSDIPEDKPE